MQTILPHNSAILVAENEHELVNIFDTITGRLLDNIREISFFISGDEPHVYILERSNILIVRYTGVFSENAQSIFDQFFAENGYNL